MRRLLPLLFIGVIAGGVLLTGCGSGEPEATKESFEKRPRPPGYNPGAAGTPAVTPPSGG